MALTQIAAMPHFIGAYGTSDIDYVLLIYFNDITLKLQVYYPTYDQYLELDLDTLTPITSATGSSDEVALTFFENGSGIGGRILSESTKTELSLTHK